GARIRGDYVSRQPRAEIITGIKSVYALEFFEQDMVGKKGFDSAILESLRRHSVRVVTKTSNANTIAPYLAGSLKAVKRVSNDLQDSFPSATISVRKVAIVTAIGSDLNVRGLTAIAVSALSSAGVEVLGVHQLIRNVDILFILAEEDYDEAVIALHRALIEERRKEDSLRKDPRKAA
ncbi:MAG TPA: aspartate kinase, partial [Woeseiaceae bacterium]|nr:aspartate kinase [Woeseiaceae bacterium]